MSKQRDAAKPHWIVRAATYATGRSKRSRAYVAFDAVGWLVLGLWVGRAL